MDENTLSVVFDAHLKWHSLADDKMYSPTLFNRIEPEIMNIGDGGELAYVLQISGALKERVWEMDADLIENQQFVSSKRAMCEGIAFEARVAECEAKKYVPSLRVTETFKTSVPASRINKELFSLINKRQFEEESPVMSYFEFERYHVAERFAHAFFVYGTSMLFRKLYYYSDEPELFDEEQLTTMMAYLVRFEEVFLNEPEALYSLNASALIDSVQAMLANFPISLSMDTRVMRPVKVACGVDSNIVPISRPGVKKRLSAFKDYIEAAECEDVGFHADFEYSRYSARIANTRYEQIAKDFPTVCNEYVKLALSVERYVRKRYRTARIDSARTLAISVVSGAWYF